MKKLLSVFGLGLVLVSAAWGWEEYTFRLLEKGTLTPIEGAKCVVGTSYYKSAPDGTLTIDIDRKSVV